MAQELRDPWLIAAWPGMGSVSLLAASYLLQKLPTRVVAEIDSHGLFDPSSIEIRHGVAGVPKLPRNMFFEWDDPRGKHDLLIFIGEAQPVHGGYTLCHKILDYASQRGAKTFFTFAAMATQLHLGNRPHVFSVSTDVSSLNQVKRLGAEVLEEGVIGGLNGVLLAAGAERGMHGTCLLGELPFFAVGVPNPRAAQVVLECFTQIATLDLDLTELQEQAAEVEEKLTQLVEQMNETITQAAESMGEQEESDEAAQESTPQSPPPPELDSKSKRRIEMLFDKVRQDRSRAYELKQELDRLGVFTEYENRFLDLFRRGE